MTIEDVHLPVDFRPVKERTNRILYPRPNRLGLTRKATK